MKASNEVQSVPGLSVQLCPTLCYCVNCNLPSPLSMDFSKQEYWSRLPFPNPGNLPSSGIEPKSVASPALAGRLFIIIWDALKSTYSVKTNTKLASRNKSSFQLKSIREIIVHVCVFNTRVSYTAGIFFTTEPPGKPRFYLGAVVQNYLLWF